MSAVPATFELPPTYRDRDRELEGLPPEERRRRELIGGEIVVRPERSAAQREVCNLLWRVLDGFVVAGKLGTSLHDPDVRLDPYNVLIPDLCFLIAKHGSQLDAHGIIGAPDLVVEVTAPDLRRLDYVRKHAIYATSGVGEYWYVDPAARLFVAYQLVDGRYELIPQVEGKVVSRVLPGLAIDVGALFLGPPGREFGSDR